MDQLIYERLKAQGIIDFDLRKTVYKYRTIRSAVKIIKSNQIYFSPVNQLNDTLELNPEHIDLSFTSENKKRYWHRLGLNDVTDEEHKGMMANSINWLRNGAIGIFSAGKTPVNAHLWQNYGAKHTGICFGFRSSVEQKVGWQILNSNAMFLGFNVKYTDNPKLIKYLDPEEDDFNSDVFCWFNTKVMSYKPEDEVRIINEISSGPETFSRELLYEVVFGKDTTQDTINFIHKLLVEHNYTVQRVGKARMQDDKMVVDYIARLSSSDWRSL